MKQINQLSNQTIVNGSKKSTLILVFLLTVFTGFGFANGTNGMNRINGTNGISGIKGADSARVTGVANQANGMNSTDGINSQIKVSFKQDFKNAELIDGEVSSKFTKLTFRMNDMILFAFYENNGKLLAIVRNILSTQLPISLMMDLKKKYKDYWITELFELNGKDQKGYYISLENADTQLVLRSNDDNTWDVYRKTEKK